MAVKHACHVALVLTSFLILGPVRPGPELFLTAINYSHTN
jgi:hypothetical protein